MRRFLIFFLLLAVAGGGTYWWVEHRAPASAGEASGRRGRGEPQRPIPVVVETVATRDVPVTLDGLGTAQASATVTVHVQVDGALQEVRFHEGQDVRVGDVLAKIDPRTYQAALDQAVAKKAQDAANLANARVDLVRYQKLATTAYTSAQQADTQKSLVAQLEAQVAQDQAQIDSARTQLTYTTITSPIDGRTGIRQVDAGNIVHAADTNGLVVITTLKPIAVVFTLPQQALRLVTAAMEAGEAEALALPQGSDSDIIDRGSLTVLDNQVDPSTGTIKMKATFPNAHLQLWPGAFVTVRLKVAVLRGATVVPPVAVQRGPRGPFVYVLDVDQTVERRPVTVGHEDQFASVIEDGVKPGERVVVDGASRLSEHSKVTVVEPAGTDSSPPPPPPARAPDRARPREEKPGTASRSGDRGNT
jgi:multidrug efflux system membrane fusion protein